MVKIYTRRGDDGSTSLYSGERVRKDDEVIALLGALDESQAALGVARAEVDRGSPLDELLIALERDLWIAMAEVATIADPVTADDPVVDSAMIERLERSIDVAMAEAQPPAGFAVPGENRLSAALDMARTIVRRAERLAVALDRPQSLVGAYLNRLSDLCWALARDADEVVRTNAGGRATPARDTLRANDVDASPSKIGEHPS